MLGACNTCVRLQSRVTSSGTTVDGLFLFVCLIVYLFLFVCLFVLVTLFAFILFLFLFKFFFLYNFGDGGMGVEALIRKILGFLGGAGHYNLCWPE